MSISAIVMVPIHNTKTWIMESGSSLPVYFRDRKELADEIADLRSQLAASGGDRYTAEALLKENSELRKLLGDENKKRILAGVIGRPNTIPYDSLMLDKGSSSGISVGAPVYIDGETVIGTIKSTTAKASLVELVTTPGFQATVYILGPNIYAHAVGIGGGQLQVGVPQGVPLSVGDLVVLPSTALNIFGSISVVDSEPSQPQQYGYVSTNIAMASIRFVSVGDRPLIPLSFEEAQKQLESATTDLFLLDIPEDIISKESELTSTSTVN